MTETTPGSGPAAPIVWLMTAHKQGDNSQVLALGEALGWPFEVKKFVYQPYELIPNFLFGPTLAAIVKDQSSPVEPPWPDLVISAGRRNEPISRWIQSAAAPEKHVRLVHLGRSWNKIERFDLIVTTPQYRLPERPNVLHNVTPLHRVTLDRIAEDAKAWRHRFDDLPKPHIAVVIGGNSGPYSLNEASATRLAKRASRLATELGGSLLATTSARTPPESADAFETAVEAPLYMFRWRKDAPENPYFAMLGLAEQIVVTADSMSMITEACATGKPVHMFDLGVGKYSMRFDPPPPDEIDRIDNSHFWERDRIRSFVYRQAMSYGPQRITRDIRRIHKILRETGRTVWLGEPVPPGPREPLHSTERAVAAIRNLFSEEEQAAGDAAGAAKKA